MHSERKYRYVWWIEQTDGKTDGHSHTDRQTDIQLNQWMGDKDTQTDR